MLIGPGFRCSVHVYIVIYVHTCTGTLSVMHSVHSTGVRLGVFVNIVSLVLLTYCYVYWHCHILCALPISSLPSFTGSPMETEAEQCTGEFEDPYTYVV